MSTIQFVEWFALVSIAIFGMFVSMVYHNDPNASHGLVVVLGIVTVLITIFAVWGSLPVFRPTRPS